MPTYDIKQFAAKKTILKNTLHTLFRKHRKIRRSKSYNKEYLFKIIGKTSLFAKSEKYISLINPQTNSSIPKPNNQLFLNNFF